MNKKDGSAGRWNDPVFVLNKIINALIIILIILGVIFLVLFVIGIKPYVVLSGSMEPKISTGSVVFVDHNAKFADLKKGDVITFRSGGLMVTHRVYEIDGEKIITKGDANEKPDNGYVTASSFVGKDVHSAPYLGYVVKFVQSWQGVAVSVGIIAALIAGSLLTGRDVDSEPKNAKNRRL